jgi:hypothetical protein
VEDAVDVIRHHNVGIEGDGRMDRRDVPPQGIDPFAERVKAYDVVNAVAQTIGAAKDANGDEIPMTTVILRR